MNLIGEDSIVDGGRARNGRGEEFCTNGRNLFEEVRREVFIDWASSESFPLHILRDTAQR